MTDTTKAMTAADVFNALNNNRVIKWEGLSDGGKWTRAIEAMELYKKEVLSSYKAELRQRIEDYIKECQVLPIHEHPAIRGLKESLELIGK